VNAGTAMVMNDGGLRSLVATATVTGPGRPMLLYIHDGRPGDERWHGRCSQQAEQYRAARRVELSLPHLMKRHGSTTQPTSLARFQLLTAAAGQAVSHDAARLVWPVSVAEQYEELATVAEWLVLLEHAVQLETGQSLTIETPLLELTLKQIVELGEQAGVPWRLARSCRSADAEPCGRCPGCTERAAAFAAAGINDPARSPAGQAQR